MVNKATIFAKNNDNRYRLICLNAGSLWVRIKRGGHVRESRSLVNRRRLPAAVLPTVMVLNSSSETVSPRCAGHGVLSQQ